MKIKTRLTLGVGLLFLLIVMLTVISIGYINALKGDTNNILAANYNTLVYSRDMILALDKIGNNPSAIADFEKTLEKQKKNETESGEKEVTDQIASHFSKLKADPNDSTLKVTIRSDISSLMSLNMEAIERKSEVALHSAQTATLWISLAGTLCFLIAFISLINLPGNIADPIKQLTESTREIAAQNYHQRVHFESNSEFGELAISFNRMAEKLDEYAGSNLAQLLMEKKRIETLINKMNDPVLGLDEQGKVIFVNDGMLTITGLHEREVMGMDIEHIARTNDLARMLIMDLNEVKQHAPAKPPLKIYANNKESYFEQEVVHINILPTGEMISKAIGHVIILKNITPFKELDFAKTNFIATVSHELKTPISSIKMGIQLLENDNTGRLNEDQAQLLESIKEDCNRLLKITKELLDISQVETGHIQVNLRKSSIYPILQYAVDMARTQAEQKHIHISTDADKNIPLINIDPEKIAWVLINFITNAIRYSPENGEVILLAKQKDEGVYCSVKDFGKGIDPKYQKRIFDRYFMVPGSAKSGTGLGLAISKDFIEAQKGRIGVETEQGSGSTFFFYLPYED